MRITKHQTKKLFIYIINFLAFTAGVLAAVALSATDASSSVYFSGFLIYLSLIAAFLFTVITLIDSYAMFAIKTSTYHSFLMALSIIICSFSSADYLTLFNIGDLYGISTVLIQYGAYAFFIFIVTVFFNYSYDLKMSLRRRLIYIVACMLSFALFASLYTVKWHFMAFFALLPLLPELFYFTSHNPRIKCFNSFSFRPVQFLTVTLSGLIFVNVLYSSGLVTNYPFGTTSFYLLTMLLTYGMIYINFIRKTQESELANARYRAQYEKVKSNSLQAQIKPHFIFNVLSSIKNLYHDDPESGDYAIDIFSKHLRAQVDATGEDMIPFEKELDNIKVFIDLENIRRKKELNVIFDIEYSDFLIPALSLQPFIENAIKYSKISEKADGYILISSRRENGSVFLKITDNGIGFDPTAIPLSSHGISNSLERFRLLTCTTPEIKSSPDIGTEIYIRFEKPSQEI